MIRLIFWFFTFQQLTSHSEPNYLTACVPPSRFPERHFCAVCGFPSNYTCVPCGARYCSVRCLGTHQDTRSDFTIIVLYLWSVTASLLYRSIYCKNFPNASFNFQMPKMDSVVLELKFIATFEFAISAESRRLRETIFLTKLKVVHSLIHWYMKDALKYK